MDTTTPQVFFQKTRKSFQYLETDFKCRWISSGVENEEHHSDTVALVRYLGTKVAIEVYWYLASSSIGVAMIEVVKNNEFPTEKYFWGKVNGGSKAIKLHTLVDMREKSNLLFLKGTRSSKVSDINKRRKIINESLDKVLQNLARVLKDEAKDILLGNTSIFPEVQEHESKLLKKEYPY